MQDIRHRQLSYNIMDDDIDNDLDIQIEIQDILESPKIFFLKNNSNEKSDPECEYLQYSNSPSSVSSNSSENSKKTTYKKLTYEEVAHSLQKNLKKINCFQN